MSDNQGHAGPFTYDLGGHQRWRGYHPTTHPETGRHCQIRLIEADESGAGQSVADWTAVFVLQQQLGQVPGSSWFPVLDQGVEEDRVHVVFPDWRRTLAEDLSEGYRAHDSEVHALAATLVSALAQLERLGQRTHDALRPDAIVFLDATGGGHDSLQPRLTGLRPKHDTEPLRRDRRVAGYLLHGYITGVETDLTDEPDYGAAWNDVPLKAKGPWRKFIEELTSGALDSTPYEELAERVRLLVQPARGGAKMPALPRIPVKVWAGLALAVVGIGMAIWVVPRSWKAFGDWRAKHAVETETARLEKQKEAERQAKVESERLAKLEADRLAKAETERLARLETERLAKLEADRLAKVQEEQARIERERIANLAKLPPPWFAGFASLPEPERVALQLNAPLQATDWVTVSNLVFNWWKQGAPAAPPRLWLQLNYPGPAPLKADPLMAQQVHSEWLRRQTYTTALAAAVGKQNAIPADLAGWVRELGWNYQPLESVIGDVALTSVSNRVKGQSPLAFDGKPDPSALVYADALQRAKAGYAYKAEQFADWNRLGGPDEKRVAFDNLRTAWTNEIAAWSKGHRMDDVRLRGVTNGIGTLTQSTATNGIDVAGLSDRFKVLEKSNRLRGSPDLVDRNLVGLEKEIALALVTLGKNKEQDALAQGAQLDQGALTEARATAGSNLAKAIADLKPKLARIPDGQTDSRRFLGSMEAAMAWLGPDDPQNPKNPKNPGWTPQSYESPENLPWYPELGTVSAEVKERVRKSGETTAAWNKALPECPQLAKIDSLDRLGALNNLLNSVPLGNKTFFDEDRARLQKYLAAVGDFNRIRKEQATVADWDAALRIADANVGFAFFDNQRASLQASRDAAAAQSVVAPVAPVVTPVVTPVPGGVSQKELDQRLAAIKGRYGEVAKSIRVTIGIVPPLLVNQQLTNLNKVEVDFENLKKDGRDDPEFGKSILRLKKALNDMKFK